MVSKLISIRFIFSVSRQAAKSPALFITRYKHLCGVSFQPPLSKIFHILTKLYLFYRATAFLKRTFRKKQIITKTVEQGAYTVAGVGVWEELGKQIKEL